MLCFLIVKNSTMPKISIIVPCYNQASYLPETLDSVLAQTYEDWECVIVNDGSPDNTEVVAKEYCDRDHRFKYLWKENGGLANARNFGIQHSTGQFILPLDSDDLIDKDYLLLAQDILDKRPEVKVVYCQADFFGDVNHLWNLKDFCWDDFLIKNCIFCTAMYRRSDYNQTNGYNPNMRYGLEDWDFWMSLLGTGGEVYKIPKVLFHYRKKNISMEKELKQDMEKVNYSYNRIILNHPEIYRRQYLSLYTRYKEITDSRLYTIFKWIRAIKRKVCR